MKKQQGFTLIELMIVVAIIGILAAVAIPQYQDYIARSQLTRVVGEVSALKTSVEENLMRGSYNTGGSNTGMTVANLGYVGSNLALSSYGDSLGLDITFVNSGLGAGTLKVTVGGDASAAVVGAIVTVSRSAAGLWSCIVTASTSASWKDSFAPAGCPKS